MFESSPRYCVSRTGTDSYVCPTFLRSEDCSKNVAISAAHPALAYF